MPELPEVETVRRGLAQVMEGRRIVEAVARRPDLRWPLPERFGARLAGRRIAGLGRRAKYLLIDFEREAMGPDGDAPEGTASDDVLVVHLGMSGSFRIEAGEAPDPAAVAAADMPGLFHLARSRAATHDHVMLRLEDGTAVIYNDPRRFGFMLLVARAELAAHPLFRDIGPEPLGNAFDAAGLARALAGRRTPVKAALLDQKIVAGLGNIYVCEALHRAGIAPERLALTLASPTARPTADTRRLVETIRTVLQEAIAAGGSTLRDHQQVDGTLGYFQHAFRAYDREGEACLTPGCRGAIARLVQSGRSTFYCASCQR